MEEHYQILEELEKRKLFNVFLRYNTNFSTLNFKEKNMLTTWNKFNNVHVSASIDANFQLGEKIRKGFSWNQFIENRKLMITTSPNTYFEITPTVSSLNINNIPGLHQLLVNENLLAINSIYLNILERPREFNIQQLSSRQKNQSTIKLERHIDWLCNQKANTSTIKEFKTLIHYLSN